MKTITVSLVFAGTLLGALALAAPPDDPDGGSPPPWPPEGGAPGRHHDGPRRGDGPRWQEDGQEKRPRWRGDFWERADTNHDGFVSKEEFFALPRIEKLPDEKKEKIFERLDKDKDGKLSKEELENFGDGPPRVPRLPELDVDKSGGVSFEEFKASEFVQKLPPEKQLELFKRLDRDGDGQITPKDRPEPRRRPDLENPEGFRQFLKRLDLDGDGVVTFEEFKKAPFIEKLSEDEQEDRFEKLDRNHDKKLTLEDLPPKPPMPPEESSEKPEHPEPPPPPPPSMPE